MGARTARSPLYAAGLGAIAAAALAGCAAGSSGTAAGHSGGGAASSSPLAAVQLAAKTTSGASSFTGTMSVQATAKSGASSSGNVSMTASMAEQLRPSLRAEVRIGTLQAAGSALPGGLTELITPSDLYMKWSFLTQELHTSKPWLVIPVSALSKSSGVNLSQLFSQATNSSPLNESQLLAGASGVRKVGTGTMDGVPVTEYTGTVSLDKGMRYLTGSAKTAMQKEVAAAGLSTATFTVWVDGQQVMRKAVINESGTALTEVITVTVSSINQPVKIQVPAADQTTSLPGGSLGRLG
ncbi:MAG TPA: hypothetical protein VHZ33_15805 [Trebonia sp.]|jgi:hypothetical protein|nr:hypothetical protein [Trebonia sp.]